jgi:ribosome-binding protein aMBF1 (putative translation factor)
MKKKKQQFKMHIIRKAIKDQGLDKVSLANKMKISKQLLNYYLQNPSIESVWKLAYYLKLNLKDLIK